MREEEKMDFLKIKKGRDFNVKLTGEEVGCGGMQRFLLASSSTEIEAISFYGEISVCIPFVFISHDPWA